MEKIWRIALVFVFVWAVAGCAETEEPPIATELVVTEEMSPITATDTPVTQEPTPTKVTETPVPKPEKGFVPGQVMITGPEEQVERLYSTFDEWLEPAEWNKDGTPQLVLGALGERCQYLPGLVGTLLRGNSDCLWQVWVVALYDIVSGPPVEEAVGEINNASIDFGFCARSDPNYLIGYPYTVAGSPYTVAGSPYTVAGSPWTNYGSTAHAADFWGQWALGQIDRVYGRGGTDEPNGQGVRVGVFDTSPFQPEGMLERFDIDLGPASATGVNSTMALTVTHSEIFDLLPVPTPTPPPPGDPPLPDLSNHGLSVAGLVHAVADGSDIYLYRVLDQYARGNLFVLNAALLDFVDNTLAAPDAPNGGVINLSLGIDHTVVFSATGMITEVHALDLMLAVAHCQGIAVVAAAGNTSNVGHIANADVPAGFPYVIGAMASNHDGNRACFSNIGDVAAPGGDGDRSGGECQPPWGACANENLQQDQCDLYSLLGPVLPSGYEAWVGTSFSAPLVSGLAALVMDERDGSLSSEEVSIAIQTSSVVPAGSDLPTGIISVTGSLLP